jgi:hypothetical protein
LINKGCFGAKSGRRKAPVSKGRQVNVHFGETEYVALQDAAKKAEMTVSAVFR